VTECPMPLGKVLFSHFLEPVTGGRVRVVKSVDVQGAFGSLLRLVAPMMRRQIDQSLLAMGRRCPHRTEQPPPDEIGGRRRTG